MKADFMRRLFLVTCILMICAGRGFAQGPLVFLTKMNQVYNTAQTYSMQVDLKMFAGNNDVTPLGTYAGEVAKSEDSYFSSIMGKTTIVNKKCTVFIDEGEKLIVYSKKEKGQKQKQAFEIPDTSSFGTMAKYSFGKAGVNDVCIEIVPADRSIYKKIEVLINRTNYTLEQVSYYYTVTENPESSVQKITIRYTAISINQPIPESKFSESHVIVYQKNKWIGLGKYASYKVTEQDNTLPDNLH